MTDHYEILGVEKNATLAQIKKAYRSMASKNHSDRGGDDEMMKNINVAYEVLSDESRRAHYDRTGQDKFVDLKVSAQNFVIQKFLHALQANIEANVIDWIKQQLRNELAGIQRKLDGGSAVIARLGKTANRLKYKGDGTNRLKEVIEDQIKNVQLQMEATKDEIAKINLAIEYVDLYDFDGDFYSQPVLMSFGARF